MIAVDTSAVLAILLDEPDGESCAAALRSKDNIVMSAGTLSEALIVAAQRGVGAEFMRLIEELEIEVIPLTKASAQRVAQAYQRWGKGRPAAGLNWGDCLAYAVAKECGYPLLYVGKDFAKTDIKSAFK
jgi:ribonuclease VapC